MSNNIEESEVIKAVRNSMEMTIIFLTAEKNRLLPLKKESEEKGDLKGAVYFGSRIEWLNTFMEMLDTGENSNEWTIPVKIKVEEL